MRILFLSTMTGFSWGGSEALWSDAARLALTRGHQVVVATKEWPNTPPVVAELVTKGAHRLEAWRAPPNGRVQRALRRLRRPPPGLVAQAKADVVVVSHAIAYEVPVQIALHAELERRAAPYVVVIQLNVDDWRLQDHERAAILAYYRGARALLFVSEHNRRLAERHLAARFDNASVISNPVNLADRSEVPWPRRSAPADPPRLASVARLDVAYKGQDVLFEVLASAPFRARPWRLALYGQGPDEAYLRRLAAQLGIADRIDLRGHVADVRGIWAENEILVMPSRSEGTPLSLCEAMTCGRPAVVTDVGGNAELVEDGVSGWIADAATPRSFGRALLSALDARASWPALGRAASAAVSSRVDPAPERRLLDIALSAAGRPQGA